MISTAPDTKKPIEPKRYYDFARTLGVGLDIDGLILPNSAHGNDLDFPVTDTKPGWVPVEKYEEMATRLGMGSPGLLACFHFDKSHPDVAKWEAEDWQVWSRHTAAAMAGVKLDWSGGILVNACPHFDDRWYSTQWNNTNTLRIAGVCAVDIRTGPNQEECFEALTKSNQSGLFTIAVVGIERRGGEKGEPCSLSEWSDQIELADSFDAIAYIDYPYGNKYRASDETWEQYDTLAQCIVPRLNAKEPDPVADSDEPD